MRFHAKVGVFVAFLAGAKCVSGQTAMSSAQVARRLAENSAALRRYSWSMRVELNAGGEKKTGLYLGLLNETALALFVFDELGGKNLEGDFAIELYVCGRKINPPIRTPHQFARFRLSSPIPLTTLQGACPRRRFND